MLNKTISDHLNELKILNYCLHWPFFAFSYAFGLGLKIENIPSTSFFAFFQIWPNRPGWFLLKIYLKLNQSQFCMVEKYKNDMKTAFKCQMQSLDYMNSHYIYIIYKYMCWFVETTFNEITKSKMNSQLSSRNWTRGFSLNRSKKSHLK